MFLQRSHFFGIPITKVIISYFHTSVFRDAFECFLSTFAVSVYVNKEKSCLWVFVDREFATLLLPLALIRG